MPEDDLSPKKRNFQRIRTDIVGRLDEEADLRTVPPQNVDFDEIHRLAAESRKKS